MVSGGILDIDSLVYTYGDKTVLDMISLNIKKGEILGILGPNGCGKTTLLKNLNKNLHPHGGCVMIDGSDIEEMSKKDIARKISVVPQSNEIRFAFTVRDIVGMGRMPFQESLRGASSDDMKITERAMEQTGIISMADRHINTMSGGERQRAIIARAVAQTPEIVLMDEPTLHLDINMQFEVLDLMKRLAHDNNLTVVIVSHDLPMVTRYCDRIMLIHEHKLFAVGTPEDVLTEENMKTVFNVDALFEKDPRTGTNTVRLFGSCGGRDFSI
ncbi:MAG: ABC transporter ATP-binding protein [Candidatus Methanoplasma sp.]|jgi:iron complex transport system ATP-binding protein|nr:ABC transporter ATP-binding protein [Candidatus Methanoplasma sp.]